MTDRRGARAAVRLAALFAVATVAFALAACGSPSPTASPLPVLPTIVPPSEPAATPEPTPVPADSEPPEPTDDDTGTAGTPPCTSAELKASHGITQADGDDRVTELILVAAETCSIDAYPALLLEDGRGKLLFAASAAGSGGIDLVGGVAYTSQVRLGNWCLGEPGYPVSIGIIEGVETITVTGDSFPDEGDLPPCAHEDADPELSGSAWQPAP